MTPPPTVASGIVATQVIGRPTAIAVGTLPARLSETARTIEPISHAPLVTGATTLNRPRSWPFTIEAIEVRPRTAMPAAAARAAFVAASDLALRERARKVGAAL